MQSNENLVAEPTNDNRNAKLRLRWIGPVLEEIELHLQSTQMTELSQEARALRRKIFSGRVNK